MKVILISGKAQHGKDTTARFLKEAFETEGACVLITHYGDLLKYICRTFFGWDGQKDEAGRSLLQYVGTEAIRRQDANFWVHFLTEMLDFFPNEWDYVIIPDCRFQNEVYEPRYLNFDTTHIRVVRPNFDNGLTPEQKAHPSETDLDEVVPDFMFMNDSTLDELRRTAYSFAKNCAALEKFRKKLEGKTDG